MGIPFKIPRAQDPLKAPAPRRPKLSSKKKKKNQFIVKHVLWMIWNIQLFRERFTDNSFKFKREDRVVIWVSFAILQI